MSTLISKPKKMPVTEHLRELRRCLIWSVAAISAAGFLVFSQAEGILAWLSEPVPRLVFISPHEALVARFKLAFFGGIVVGMPVILYQIGSFIWPGLSQRERQMVKYSGPAAAILFYMGAFFGATIVVPITLRFLMGFGGWLVEPMISVDRFISFSGFLLISFGAIFELPVAIVLLTKIGIVTPAFLRQKRPIVIISIFVLAALITPPDIVTQSFVAIPMLILYEMSILLSYWFKLHPEAK